MNYIVKKLRSGAKIISYYYELARTEGVRAAGQRFRRKTAAALQYGLFDKWAKVDEAHETGAFTELYEPTPHQIIRTLPDLLPQNLSDWTFIDIGSGKGRVLIHTAKFPFKKVIGVEFSSELTKIAQGNINAINEKDMRCGAIEAVCEDACEFTIPDGPFIIYMFNPLESDMMQKFVDHLTKSNESSPRHMMLIYFNPKQEHAFKKHERWTKVHVPTMVRLKMLLSPYGLSVYEHQ